MRYREACNKIPQAQYESHIIRPMIESCSNPEFVYDIRGESKYQSLFQYHGEDIYDIRRQSFLEFMIRFSAHRIRETINKTRARLVALSDSQMLLVYDERIDAFNRNHGTETLETPEGFFHSAWTVYKASLQDPRYFF